MLFQRESVPCSIALEIAAALRVNYRNDTGAATAMTGVE